MRDNLLVFSMYAMSALIMQWDLRIYYKLHKNVENISIGVTGNAEVSYTINTYNNNTL